MKKIFLWGTGKVATEIVEQFKQNIFCQYDVLGFVDNSSDKQGKYFNHIFIFSPEILKEMQYDLIVVLNDSFTEVKKQAIEKFNCDENKIKNKYFFCEQEIFARYEKCHDREIREVLFNIKKYGLRIFNYEYVEQYQNMRIDVQYDYIYEMFFVMHNGKRMYFKKDFNSKTIVEEYYRNLLIEQDIMSPHRYIDEAFRVEKGDVVVDAGVAEGNFSLDIIDKVSKLYLVESDCGWIEALEKTFENYRDKVVFVCKSLSSYRYGVYETLDNIIDESVNFIKMDIEGNEWEAMLGANRVIKQSDRLRCALCTYHIDYAEEILDKEMKKYGMKCSTTYGYMWFPYLTQNRYMSTKLHRGIIRGEKGYSENV